MWRLCELYWRRTVAVEKAILFEICTMQLLLFMLLVQLCRE